MTPDIPTQGNSVPSTGPGRSLDAGSSSETPGNPAARSRPRAPHASASGRAVAATSARSPRPARRVAVAGGPQLVHLAFRIQARDVVLARLLDEHGVLTTGQGDRDNHRRSGDFLRGEMRARNVHVSRDVPTDPAIGGLLDELGYPLDADVIGRRWRSATTGGHMVLVAVIDGRIAGVVSAAAIPLLAEADILVRITALSVTSTLRGRGVGRALVAAVERRARSVGAAVVEVGSGRRPERAAAHRFYPALGYSDANRDAAMYWKWFERSVG